MNHILRIVRVVRGHGRLYLRSFVQFGQIFLGHLEELVERTARAVLHDERHTRVGREARNHWRCESQDLSILDVGRLLVDQSQHRCGIVGIDEETVDTVALPQSGELPPETFLALVEGLQLDDERCLVRTGTGDEVVTLNLLAALDGRIGSQERVDLTDDHLGAFYRSGRRHRDGAEQRTRVFIGHQTRLCRSHRRDQSGNTQHNGNADDDGLTHQFLDAVLIFAQHLVVGCIEGRMEAVDARHLHLVALFVVRLQEDGTKRRRERQGVQGRNEDAHSHCHTELSIERTARAADERHGDEHRRHHERDGDDGTRNLVHGIDRGCQRRLVALVELGVHGLDHHDGVVHHDGDGQQQGRQRQQVDGEAEYLQEEERTDQRDRHSDERGERRAPVLQEDVDDEEHQQQGEDEGEDHLFDRSIEELRHVVVDLIVHARREQLGLFFQLLLHVDGYLVGVRTGNLLHHTHHRRDVVVLHRDGVLQSAQLDLGHVLQLQRRAVGVALDDDVAKLLGCLQSTRIAHGILIGHVGTLTERTRGGLDVLFGQNAGDVGGHQAVLFHHLRLQPDAHRVGLHARRHHVAHALYTLDGRNDVDVRIVGQELVVVASVARQGEHHHLRGLTLHHRDTNLRHLSGQQGLSLLHAVLYVDGTHVGVHALTEEDAQTGRSAGCRRRDVVHALHTVDTLFQRHEHGVLHRLGIGTRIAGEDDYRRRCDVWILLDRQCGQTYEA